MSMATKSSRFEVMDTLTVHGHEGVLLLEMFSGDWVASVDMGDRPCTVRGKDREEVLRGIKIAVRRLVTGRVQGTAAA